MTKSRLKNCFISSTFGTDTSNLRKALDRAGIKWVDFTSFEVGSDLSKAIRNALGKADFVCAVLGREPNLSVMFEMGMATGLRKPVLALAAPDVEASKIPANIVLIRTIADDADEIFFSIEMFIKNAETSKVSARRASRKILPQGVGIGKSHRLLALASEKALLEFIREAGFIASDLTDDLVHGADFAIWISELQSQIGNPILVEVKRASSSQPRIQEEVRKLQAFAEKSKAAAALLIISNPNTTLFTVSPSLPLVFQFDIHTFLDAVVLGELPTQLLKLRNLAAHGQL
jgi:nucleoside 2-deoxyribosyltransferase